MNSINKIARSAGFLFADRRMRAFHFSICNRYHVDASHRHESAGF
jgi:hypothetical protein